MKEPSLEDLLNLASDQLRSEFRQAAAVPHPAIRGREREETLITFLNSHLPRRCAASSGYLLDPSGRLSPHLDIIVYDAINSPIYRPSEAALILPTDNAATVIEVKSRLTMRTLKDAMAHLSKVKALGKSGPREYRSAVDEESGRPTWERAATPPGSFDTRTVLFAYETDFASIEKIGDAFFWNYATCPPGSQIDYVFVLDVGMVCLMISDPEMSPSLDTYCPTIFPPWTARGHPKSTLVVVQPTSSPRSVGRMVRLEGCAFQPGAAIAVGANPLGKRTLDAFFRVILMHISNFRGWVTWPGGNWGGKNVWLQPLGVAIEPMEEDKLCEAAMKRFEAVAQALAGGGTAPDGDSQ